MNNTGIIKPTPAEYDKLSKELAARPLESNKIQTLKQFAEKHNIKLTTPPSNYKKRMLKKLPSLFGDQHA